MRASMTALTALAALGAAVLGAAAPAAAQGLTYTRDTYTTVKSAYVFRGLQRAEEIVQLGGEVRLNGVHLGGAWLQPFDGAEAPSEARLYGGWSPHIEDHGSPIDVELGFTWYATPDSAPGFAEDSRFEPYAKLYLDTPLAPSLAGFYDTELETYTVEGRLTHYVPFGLNGIQFGFDGGLVSPENGQEHTYAQGSIDYVRNFLSGLEGFVGVRTAVSSEDRYFDTVTPAGPIYDQDNKTWIAFGLAATF
ncbi:MAG: hypothetical protein PVI23_14560 [Maricaulaceae bacterium]|jgi:hypothetical protein